MWKLIVGMLGVGIVDCTPNEAPNTNKYSDVFTTISEQTTGQWVMAQYHKTLDP